MFHTFLPRCAWEPPHPLFAAEGQAKATSGPSLKTQAFDTVQTVLLLFTFPPIARFGALPLPLGRRGACMGRAGSMGTYPHPLAPTWFFPRWREGEGPLPDPSRREDPCAACHHFPYGWPVGCCVPCSRENPEPVCSFLAQHRGHDHCPLFLPSTTSRSVLRSFPVGFLLGGTVRIIWLRARHPERLLDLRGVCT